MGIRISIFEGNVPACPEEIELSLMCDAEKHEQGFLGFDPRSAFARFRHPDGFMGCYSQAMAAGWKDTYRNGKRVFLGPCCSGKEVRDGSKEYR